MDKYYKPSGNYTLFFIPLFILVSLTLIPLLAFLYSYLNIFFQEITPLNVLLIILFAIFLVRVAHIPIIAGAKVRNAKLGKALGFLIGVTAFYFYLGFLIILISDPSLTISNLIQVTEPLELLQKMERSHSELLNAVFLFLKVGFIFFVSIVAGAGLSEVPFSEANNVWFKGKKILVNFVEDKVDFVESLEKGDYDILDHLKKSEGKKESHAVLWLYYTPYGEFYLRGKNRVATLNKDNQMRFKKDRFLKGYIMIDPSQGQRLLML